MSILTAAYRLAKEAHAGQTDKLGVPYFEHVYAVAAGLAFLGDDEVTAAGWLHDVLEDTALTRDDLLVAGVSERTVRIVEAVTNTPGGSYEEKIASITDPGAVLVKIADNAHNSRHDRLIRLDESTYMRLVLKYMRARRVLWPRADRSAVRTIIGVVNKDLTHQVDCDFCWDHVRVGSGTTTTCTYLPEDE